MNMVAIVAGFHLDICHLIVSKHIFYINIDMKIHNPTCYVKVTFYSTAAAGFIVNYFTF